MKITLINLYPELSPANYFAFNHGLGYLSAILKKEDHQVRLLSLCSSGDENAREIEKIDCEMIFIYLSTHQYPLFLSLLPSLKKRKVPLFIGGPHPTVQPEEMLKLEGITGLCIGEGEETARKIAKGKGKNLRNIPNLWYREQGTVYRNRTGLWTRDLDALPFPDREIFPYQYMLSLESFKIMGFEFMASRGCPYACRYCINPLLNRMGCPMRRRCPENIITEIEEVTGSYHYRGIIGFHDDIFPLNRGWLREFSEEYASCIGLPFWCNARIDLLDKISLNLLKKAGCFRIHLGIECGNEELRKRVLGKGISNYEILEKVRMIKDSGIKVVTSFMMGLPGEKEENIRESVELCKKIRPAWVLRSLFCPYPGTELYQELVRKRTIAPDFYVRLSTDSFFSPVSALPSPHLSPEKLKYYYENFIKLCAL